MLAQRALVVLSMVWMSCAWVGRLPALEGSTRVPPTQTSRPDREALQLNAAASVLVEVNLARQENGLQALRPRPDLMEVARQRGEDMIQLEYFDHVDPQSGAVEAEQLMRARDYSGALGELLFATTVDLDDVPQEAIRAWLDSQENRRTLLEEDYHLTGAAVIEADGWSYVVQVMAERGP